MTLESSYKVFYLAQLIYLLSMRNYFIPYFSKQEDGGLVIGGRFSHFLSKEKVRVIYLFWGIACFLSLILTNKVAWVSSFICLIFSRYFFIYLRYKSVGRGNGAPGYMSYWTISYGFLFGLFQGAETGLALVYTLMKLDFALIMLSAAYYKYRTGYTRGRGIEFGLRNEMWSWGYKVFRRIPLNSVFFKVLNFSSVAVEIAICILLLIPGLEKYAGALLAAMFIILLIVRLGTLPITMLCLSFVIIFMKPGNEIRYEWFHVTSIISTLLLLTLGLAWSWIYYLRLNLPLQIAKVLKFAYVITGTIIWSVFTARLTENYVVIKQIRDDEFYILKAPDAGVHAGISLTTIATYTDYFPQGIKDQENRLRVYIRSMYPREYDIEVTFFRIYFSQNETVLLPIKSIYLLGSGS